MSDLRNYKKDTPQYKFYAEMHKKVDLEYTLKMRKKYSKYDNCKMSIKKALSMMDDFIDPSDPDLDVPNSIHAYQTAERIRKKYPEDKELQIAGLIHDLGKVLFSYGEPNYAVVGDTYVLGCKFPDTIVYPETMEKNKDYFTYYDKCIYEKNCGLDKLIISFGHDEYLYGVLKHNKDLHKMTDRTMNMIRYHSLYPWHSYSSYDDFMKRGDEFILVNVLEFNSFDLYSKEDPIEINQSVKDYYDKLLDEYFFGEMEW